MRNNCRIDIETSIYSILFNQRGSEWSGLELLENYAVVLAKKIDCIAKSNLDSKFVKTHGPTWSIAKKDGKKIHIHDLGRGLLPSWAVCMSQFMDDVVAAEEFLQKQGKSRRLFGPAAKNLNEPAGSPQISKKILDRITPEMIDDAIANFDSEGNQQFANLEVHDLVLTSIGRLPLDAILGIALSQALGRTATPSDLSAIRGQRCFEIVEDAGYPIVSKNEPLPLLPPEADDERSWAEGSPKRVSIYVESERQNWLGQKRSALLRCMDTYTVRDAILSHCIVWDHLVTLALKSTTARSQWLIWMEKLRHG